MREFQQSRHHDFHKFLVFNQRDLIKRSFDSIACIVNQPRERQTNTVHFVDDMPLNALLSQIRHKGEYLNTILLLQLCFQI